VFLGRIFICSYVVLWCISGFSQQHSKIDEEIESIKKSIHDSEIKLKKITQEKIKKRKLLDRDEAIELKSHPIYPFSTYIKESWLAKDYTRYPANPYPNLFQYSTEDGNNNIQFHFWYQGDLDSLMNIHGLFVNDGTIQTPIGKSNSIQRFWNRRIRPTVQGDLYDYINYFLNIDFGQNNIALYDAFIDINYYRLLGLQIGQQMSLVSGIENYFENFSYLSRAFTMEMSHTAMLAPDRQVGAMFHGSFGPSGQEPYYQGLSLLGFDDYFSYQFGGFIGTADNSNPKTIFNPDTFALGQPLNILNYDFEARIFMNPFISYQNSFLEHLGFGVAFSAGHANNQQNLPGLLSIAQNMFYNYEDNYPFYTIFNVIANGQRTRIHPQAVWSYGPLGIIGDWTQTTQQLGLFNRITEEYPYITTSQTNQASMLSFIYNLTKEDFNLFHFIPNNNFHPLTKGEYGGWQLVFRLSQLNLDPSVFQSKYNVTLNNKDYVFYSFIDPRTSIQKANSWSIGLNWYWNQFLRFTFEYDQSSYVGGCSTGAMDTTYGTPGCQMGNMGTYLASSQIQNRPDEKVYMTRIQLTF
jgi:phosphate-selective porin OprO/OprP